MARGMQRLVPREVGHSVPPLVLHHAGRDRVRASDEAKQAVDTPTRGIGLPPLLHFRQPGAECRDGGCQEVVAGTERDGPDGPDTMQPRIGSQPIHAEVAVQRR